MLNEMATDQWDTAVAQFIVRPYITGSVAQFSRRKS